MSLYQAIVAAIWQASTIYSADRPISQNTHLRGGLAVFGGWVLALLSFPQETSLSSGKGGANHVPLTLQS